MSKKNIDELAWQAAQMLADLGYTHGTIQHYKTTWKKVKRWCLAQDLEWFGPDQEHLLIQDMGLDENVLSPGNRSMLRHIRTLLSLEDDGCLPSFSRARPPEVPVGFRHVFEAYMSHLEQRGLAQTTRRT